MASRGSSAGKRAGARRGVRQRQGVSPRVLLLAAGITVAVIAWGYLVWTAISFGGDARDGDGRAWGFLALSTVGAVACLFAGLMLLARLSRAIGFTSAPPPPVIPAPEPPTRPVDAPPVDAPPAGAPTISGAPVDGAPGRAAPHRHRAD